uniref:Trimethylguanosine synthase n=1 Tax=Chaetoceros debilis TaxID=122233 RepID=A0A7S3Q9J8_9STRA|mmetsp:Transcript_3802/g.5692  ORF Transcript_3802/g.5692 Transcript_3802/m.5692 type:complete len:563 (+) Transcript_3802:1329-3017(+)
MNLAERELLELLCVELYLDGGKTFVTSFVDFYDANKIIPRLLKRCGQNKKLLSFLESYPDHFLVSGRGDPPHVVTLQENGFKFAEKCTQDRDGGAFITQLESAAHALELRVAYVLRKRISKISRRAQRENQSTNVANLGIGPVPVAWLSRKCLNDLHRYTRLLPSRPANILPHCNEWMEATAPVFVEFLSNTGSKMFVITEEEVVDNDKEETLIDITLEEKKHVIESLSNTCATNRIDVEALSERIVSLLEDLAPVGGVQFGRLLNDKKVRNLLGGIDLLVVMKNNQSFFKTVSLFEDEIRDQWFIKLEKNESKNGKSQGNEERKLSNRLIADEVGTYSVTNATLATAMAKIICKTLRTMAEDKMSISSLVTVYRKTLPQTALAIDLTSGIGGNTIGLAKMFPNVIGYEIDKERFQMLRQNVNNRVIDNPSRVVLECRDSISALAELSQQYRKFSGDESEQPLIGVIVDPPFGGIHYRHKSCHEDLNLGDGMSLSQVVALVAKNLAPVVIGMKLPLDFEVKPFLNKLQEMPHFCSTKSNACLLDVITVKKMRRQLFMVLKLH